MVITDLIFSLEISTDIGTHITMRNLDYLNLMEQIKDLKKHTDILDDIKVNFGTKNGNVYGSFMIKDITAKNYNQKYLKTIADFETMIATIDPNLSARLKKTYKKEG